MTSTINNSEEILKINKSIFELENFFVANLGPQILDYIFLFSKEESQTIKFEQVTEEVSKAMTRFVELVKQLMNLLEVEDATPTDGGLSEKFIDSMHDLYLLRFIEAKKQYADYQLVRVPTNTELRILDLIPTKDEDLKILPTAINIQLPDIFIVDEMGNLDVAASIQLEDSYHKIASYLSTIAEIPNLKEQMIQDLADITIFENAPSLLRNELLDISEMLLTLTVNYFAARVYGYLSRGQSVKEARTNVLAYYKMNSIGAGSKFPESLKDLEESIDEILDEELESITALYPETRVALKDDYKELLLFYIHDALIIPENFYKIVYRDLKDYQENDEKYNILIDLYLLLEEGQMIPLPSETYNIDLTQEARTLIFNAVTGGLESPNFTLIDYLSEVS
ncbi:MAG: hypothetical protein UZ20_WS6002000506 [candidate division WS6 bacterium OLB21]|uniref:Uncharacterized protein n=2 Tax=Candidatus Dojkabacteria TaxID=74243 RepID=A0A136KJ60_9BACT|nr:MAG: hypothetical protein UZ20_WS6002000506 [candidate division WS6 bacterium OLB21]